MSLIFCVYIIFAVGIDIEGMRLPIIECLNGKAQNINNILLSLSYSFMAGAIFYFYVTYIPNKKRKLGIFILLKNDLEYIKTHCYALLFRLNSVKIPDDIEMILLDEARTRELIMDLFHNEEKIVCSDYDLADLEKFGKGVLEIINKINMHINYLSPSQIDDIHTIKDCKLQIDRWVNQIRKQNFLGEDGIQGISNAIHTIYFISQELINSLNNN